MKLLLVTPEFPPDLGGIAAYLGALFSESPSAEDTVLVHKISWHTLQTRWLYPHWLPAFFSTLRMCWQERPDRLCISHVLPLGTVALIINWWLKIPFVVFLHGTDLMQTTAKKRKKDLASMIINRADTVFVNSLATNNLLVKLFGFTAAKILYPGIDLPATKNNNVAWRAQSGLENKFLLLFLGRWVKRKGAARAVSAVEKLRVKYPQVHLVILGDGPERENILRQITEQHLEKFVTLVGRVNEEEKWSWLQTADCLIFPYQAVAGEWEGLGIVALEAAAAGLPVIATAAEGLSEAFDPPNTGLALNHGTADELVGAIQKLIENPDLALAMRAKALKFAAQFSIANMRKIFAATLHKKI